MNLKLNLQRFAEEGTGTAAPEPAAAETAPAAESTTEDFRISAGETLADGQVVSSQVAAEMNKQMARHPELRKVYGQGRKQAAQQAPAEPAGAQTAEKTIEERWNEAKKGEFAELYGRDVQSAVQDRFRNQADLTAQMKQLEPMLAVLRERAGVKSNEELISHVMDDDSLYEEAANEAGMTVAAYKEFKKLEAQRDEMQQREEESLQKQMVQDHIQKLVLQAEELKKQYPEFDLREELKNERFFKMTSPEGGVPVADAFFAIHHNELAPQMMAYGMERAKQQMGQTLQAQRSRPMEGAMKTQGQPAADFNLDPRAMSRPERNKIYELIHKGKLTWGG